MSTAALKNQGVADAIRRHQMGEVHGLEKDAPGRLARMALWGHGMFTR